MNDNPWNKLYLRKTTNILLYPLYLDVEITNQCNLACKMCGTNYSKRRKGIMDMRTFKKVINISTKYNIPLRIIGWGEPSMHPDYYSMLEYAKQQGILLHINTNGYMELPSNIGSVKYSFHGQKINYNKHQPWVTGTTTDLEKVKAPKWVKVNKQDTRWIDGQNRSTKRFDRCGEVFDKLTIFWTGEVTACCSDVELKLKLGSIHSKDIIKIWRESKLLNYMRTELRKKNWNCTDLCKNCFSYV